MPPLETHSPQHSLSQTAADLLPTLAKALVAAPSLCKPSKPRSSAEDPTFSADAALAVPAFAQLVAVVVHTFVHRSRAFLLPDTYLAMNLAPTSPPVDIAHSPRIRVSHPCSAAVDYVCPASIVDRTFLALVVTDGG